MKLTNFYYQIKPLLPVRARMAIRRLLAEHIRRTHQDVWPINQAAARKPSDWPGWPDGKDFAFILTHDVEGQKGFDRVRQLAELEAASGFRSSFNFVPEGTYNVTEDTRLWLNAHGFEVGVHDLHHDGKLYRSREIFRRNAQQINHYIKEWDVTGFRSAFMFHRLDWLHDLEIRYDASTFDIDPFEPQPDGVGTIFPFWVAAPDRPQNQDCGYVELPYTLTQDSTLFLTLQEKSIATWKRKLDWIVQMGGMVLVNVHPDYTSFNTECPKFEYPVERYRELLEYVNFRYGGRFWHATANEIARFARRAVTRTFRIPKSVCMLAYSFYESDNRIRRYAEALTEAGDCVEVVALGDSTKQANVRSVNGVKVHHIQTRRRDEHSALSYLQRLIRFTVVATVYLYRLHRARRFSLIHVHNVPDFLVFAALPAKLLGARVILDIHDIVPEFYVDKFRVNASALIVRALKWVERQSARCADHVILSNHLWFERFVRRSAPATKCSTFVNRPDAKLFYPRPRTRNDGKTIVIYPGGLQQHQGLDIALHAISQIVSKLPGLELHIYGDGSAEKDLIELKEKLGLDDEVFFHPCVSVEEVPALMSNADLGIVPKRASGFGNEAYSTKILEFMSVGVPVVASNTKIDRYYFNDTLVRFFESGDSESMGEAMLEVLSDPELRRGLIERASDFAMKQKWEAHKSEYVELVDRLCTPRRDV